MVKQNRIVKVSPSSSIYIEREEPSGVKQKDWLHSANQNSRLQTRQNIPRQCYVFIYLFIECIFPILQRKLKASYNPKTNKLH